MKRSTTKGQRDRFYREHGLRNRTRKETRAYVLMLHRQADEARERGERLSELRQWYAESYEKDAPALMNLPTPEDLRAGNVDAWAMVTPPKEPEEN